MAVLDSVLRAYQSPTRMVHAIGALSALGEETAGLGVKRPLVVTDDNILFVHASAAAPEQWIYVSGLREAEDSLRAGKAPYIFSGHVHEQKLYYTGASGKPLPFRPVPGTPIPAAKHRQWLAIVGSAGQPRDDPGGTRVVGHPGGSGGLTRADPEHGRHDPAALRRRAPEGAGSQRPGRGPQVGIQNRRSRVQRCPAVHRTAELAAVHAELLA